jgi:hypothetical protein
MNTIDTKTSRAALAAIVIFGALALSFAAIATLGVDAGDTGGGVFARLGDYLAAVSEALGGG